MELRDSRRLAFVAVALSACLLDAQPGQGAPRGTHAPQRLVLPNGLTLVFLDHGRAPVFTAVTLVKAGAAQDPPGKSGLAHVLEHMVSKTPLPRAWRDEARVQAGDVELAAARDPARAELRALPGPGTDGASTPADARLGAWLAPRAALDHVGDHDYRRVLGQAGAIDIKAATLPDTTFFEVSLPLKWFELWASLESQRLLSPSWEGLERELRVVEEEWRTRMDGDPTARFLDDFLKLAAPDAHYRQPVLGQPDEVRTLARGDVAAFFERHYTADNIVVVVVGHFDRVDVQTIVRRHFGRLARSRSRAAETVPAVPETAPVRAAAELASASATGSLYVEAYPRPAVADDERGVCELIYALLCDGASSRLQRALVRERRLATSVTCAAASPGVRYASLFLLAASPTAGSTHAELSRTVTAELDALRQSDVEAAELEFARRRLKANLARIQETRAGLAEQMAFSEAYLGGAAAALTRFAQYDTLTAADVRRAATALFQSERRVGGWLHAIPPAGADARVP